MKHNKCIKSVIVATVLVIMFGCKKAKSDEVNFSLNYLKVGNPKLNDSSKIYLKFYFDELNFEEAQQGLFNNKYPSIKDSFSRLINDPKYMGLFPRRLITKEVDIEGSNRTTRVLDSAYYDSIPLSSMIKLSKDFYEQRMKLSKEQERNLFEINNAIKLLYNPKVFIRTSGSEVVMNFGFNNKTSKDIDAIYGNLSLEDNFGNIILSGDYPYEQRLSTLTLEEYDKMKEGNGWVINTVASSKEDYAVIRKINDLGPENLKLKFIVSRIKFSDGTILEN